MNKRYERVAEVEGLGGGEVKSQVKVNQRDIEVEY